MEPMSQLQPESLLTSGGCGTSFGARARRVVLCAESGTHRAEDDGDVDTAALIVANIVLQPWRLTIGQTDRVRVTRLPALSPAECPDLGEQSE